MHALSYSVRPPAVLKYFGQLCIILALLTLVPLVVSLMLGEYRSTLRYAIVAASLCVIWLFLRRLPSPRSIQTNEAMVVTALAFLFTPLVMAWPLMFSGLTFGDALFEAISGVTTTGLSVTASVADKPAIFLFSRSWLQWTGGLGIVVLFLATMVRPGLVAKRIGYSESYEEDIVGSARATARRIIAVYLALTVFGIAVLGSLGAGWFNSVAYSFSAVSTGGFSPRNGSLAGLSLPLQAVVMLLCVAGAAPLILYFRSVKEHGWAFIRDHQVPALLIAGLVASLLTALFLFTQDAFSPLEALHHGFLNAFSAQTGAGFSTLNISQISPGAKLTLIFFMFLGGCVGSTSGGIKILRLLILGKVLYVFLQRPALPRQAVAHASLGRRPLEADEIQGALSIVLVFLLSIGISWLVFVGLRYDPLDSLFEVVSATGTVGLSSGITGPELPSALKGILSADMLLGRLEIIALLVLLYPGTWIGRRLEETR